MQDDTLSQYWAWQPATAPSQSEDQEGKQLVYLKPFHIHTTILFFTFMIVFNILLYYEIGFVPDHFAQM